MEIIPLITNFLIYILAALLLVLIISYIYRLVRANSISEEEKIHAQRDAVRKYIRTHSDYITNAQKYRSNELNKVKYSAPHYSTTNKKTSSAFGTRTNGTNSSRYSILNSHKKETAEFYFPSAQYSQSRLKNQYFQ